MKFLLDMSVSPSLLDVIREHGHDGVHAARRNLNQATDEELMSVARQEVCIIVTADLDFPRLLALSIAGGPGIILFRGGNYSDSAMRSLLERVLDHVPATEMERSIVVVDSHRLRITRLPLGTPSSDTSRELESE